MRTLYFFYDDVEKARAAVAALDPTSVCEIKTMLAAHCGPNTYCGVSRLQSVLDDATIGTMIGGIAGMAFGIAIILGVVDGVMLWPIAAFPWTIWICGMGGAATGLLGALLRNALLPAARARIGLIVMIRIEDVAEPQAMTVLRHMARHMALQGANNVEETQAFQS
jgi:hypothetical protein